MPCYGPGGPTHVGDEETVISYDELRYLRRMKNEMDKVTRLLCGVMTFLEDNDILDEVIADNPELEKWWEEHKALDRKRLKKQRIARRNKLREIKNWMRENQSDLKFLKKKFRQLKAMADEDYDEQDFNFERDV